MRGTEQSEILEEVLIDDGQDDSIQDDKEMTNLSETEEFGDEGPVGRRPLLFNGNKASHKSSSSQAVEEDEIEDIDESHIIIGKVEHVQPAETTKTADLQSSSNGRWQRDLYDQDIQRRPSHRRGGYYNRFRRGRQRYHTNPPRNRTRNDNKNEIGTANRNEKKYRNNEFHIESKQLEKKLESIEIENYPKSKVEVQVVDAGSDSSGKKQFERANNSRAQSNSSGRRYTPLRGQKTVGRGGRPTRAYRRPYYKGGRASVPPQIVMQPYPVAAPTYDTGMYMQPGFMPNMPYPASLSSGFGYPNQPVYWDWNSYGMGYYQQPSQISRPMTYQQYQLNGQMYPDYHLYNPQQYHNIGYGPRYTRSTWDT